MPLTGLLRHKADTYVEFLFSFQFAKDVKFISECFNGTFAQASFRNKEVRLLTR